MKEPLYLLDGYSVIYRSYFGFIRNPIINSKRQNVSAIFGFFNTIFSFYKKYNPKRFYITLDSPTPTFRHEMYEEYKANRDKAPQDLHDQVQPIIDLLKAMGLPAISYDGLEADDLMGALAKKEEREGGEAYIISGDKDLLQLVSPQVFVLKPDKGQFIKMGEADVMEDRGVRPDQMIDYLALMGDSADNIPGVAGIGPKTAVKLLGEYETLENLYDNVEKIKAAGQRNKLIENRENAFFSKKLVEIITDMDYEKLNINENMPCDAALVKELFGKWELPTLLADFTRLFTDGPVIEAAGASEAEEVERKNWKNSGAEYIGISDKSVLEEVLKKAADSLFLAFDCETNALDEMKAEPVGVSFSFEPNKAYYIPIKCEGAELLEEEYIKTQLQELFDKGKFQLIGQNFKYDYKVLTRWGLSLPPLYFDTMIAAWMLESDERSNMDALALKYLDYETIHFSDVVPKGKTFDKVPLEQAVPYAAEDSDITLQLFTILKKKLIERELDKLFYQLEMPLVYLLAKMEMTGITLKKDELVAYGVALGEELDRIEKEIYELCGEEFNIRSTKELQRILFEVRELPTGKKTKTGYSTDIKVLTELAKQDPVPELILRHRGLAKLKSTYVDSLSELVDEKGKLHTHFAQTGTATGRIASRDPNLQNIPVRDEKGRMIRMAFASDEGQVFLSADYSQIELVVLAHLSDDTGLKDAFSSGEDVHKQTASLIFGKSTEEVTADERRIAKTINFGVMYGMSAFRLSNELKIPRKDAAEFIKTYFEKYAGVKTFIEKTIEDAREEGGVSTMMGRFRTIRGINSRNKTEQQGAERAAVNSRIQGSAADIVKKAMLDLAPRIETEFPRAKMLLQVHDECIFQVPEEEMNRLAQLVQEVMESAVTLSIPLRVNVETGHRWGEIH
ncbi:MAG: DNA polymerase I [Spirochaetales bacterium]|nr:DNA polymerase I [Spirochaetales bacterium]